MEGQAGEEVVFQDNGQFADPELSVLNPALKSAQ